MTYEIQDSVQLSASPEQVYELLSDITRTGEWSQQCHRCEWESDDRGVGARFVGHNRTPEREWQTVSEVVADVTREHFAWSVGPGRAVWGYRMRPSAGGGTELTEYTRTSPTFEEFFTERYGDRAEEEIATRQEAARAGIPATLATIRGILDGR
ncbi:SRPBCC family protein [Brachybacterium endophyticum]|uniref:SRPBCC family protein n=1 Tax=Brachybacterium endophyticum TaxID=2182385 RepID=A0A2U2RP28_9MICO|nr:SRPBCC family protein [Brachybacterium endophyticum]PWH07632.1 SRPBCC family protein [Brachybacterium endophyticum]